MTAKHEPTPWEVHKRRLSDREKGGSYSPFEILHPLINTDEEYKGQLGGYHVVIGKANCQPGYILDEADAAFIVKACNCHDDLLEALQDCMAGIDAVLKMAQQHDPSTGYLKGVSPFDILKVLQINPICVTARETLAKAKGE